MLIKNISLSADQILIDEPTVREKPNKSNASREYRVLLGKKYLTSNRDHTGDFIWGNVEVMEHLMGSV